MESHRTSFTEKLNNSVCEDLAIILKARGRYEVTYCMNTHCMNKDCE